MRAASRVVNFRCCWPAIQRKCAGLSVRRRSVARNSMSSFAMEQRGTWCYLRGRMCSMWLAFFLITRPDLPYCFSIPSSTQHRFRKPHHSAGQCACSVVSLTATRRTRDGGCVTKFFFCSVSTKDPPLGGAIMHIKQHSSVTYDFLLQASDKVLIPFKKI